MVHLDCDTCLGLWAEYGAAIRTNIALARRGPEFILCDIHAHEATHRKLKLRDADADADADESEVA